MEAITTKKFILALLLLTGSMVAAAEINRMLERRRAVKALTATVNAAGNAAK